MGFDEGREGMPVVQFWDEWGPTGPVRAGEAWEPGKLGEFTVTRHTWNEFSEGKLLASRSHIPLRLGWGAAASGATSVDAHFVDCGAAQFRTVLAFLREGTHCLPPDPRARADLLRVAAQFDLALLTKALEGTSDAAIPPPYYRSLGQGSSRTWFGFFCQHMPKSLMQVDRVYVPPAGVDTIVKRSLQSLSGRVVNVLGPHSVAKTRSVQSAGAILAGRNGILVYADVRAGLDRRGAAGGGVADHALTAAEIEHQLAVSVIDTSLLNTADLYPAAPLARTGMGRRRLTIVVHGARGLPRDFATHVRVGVQPGAGVTAVAMPETKGDGGERKGAGGGGGAVASTATVPVVGHASEWGERGESFDMEVQAATGALSVSLKVVGRAGGGAGERLLGAAEIPLGSLASCVGVFEQAYPIKTTALAAPGGGSGGAAGQPKVIVSVVWSVFQDRLTGAPTASSTSPTSKYLTTRQEYMALEQEATVCVAESSTWAQAQAIAEELSDKAAAEYDANCVKKPVPKTGARTSRMTSLLGKPKTHVMFEFIPHNETVRVVDPVHPGQTETRDVSVYHNAIAALDANGKDLSQRFEERVQVYLRDVTGKGNADGARGAGGAQRALDLVRALAQKRSETLSTFVKLREQEMTPALDSLISTARMGGSLSLPRQHARDQLRSRAAAILRPLFMKVAAFTIRDELTNWRTAALERAERCNANAAKLCDETLRRIQCRPGTETKAPDVGAASLEAYERSCLFAADKQYIRSLSRRVPPGGKLVILLDRFGHEPREELLVRQLLQRVLAEAPNARLLLSGSKYFSMDGRDDEADAPDDITRRRQLVIGASEGKADELPAMSLWPTPTHLAEFVSQMVTHCPNVQIARASLQEHMHAMVELLQHWSDPVALERAYRSQHDWALSKEKSVKDAQRSLQASTVALEAARRQLGDAELALIHAEAGIGGGETENMVAAAAGAIFSAKGRADAANKACDGATATLREESEELETVLSSPLWTRLSLDMTSTVAFVKDLNWGTVEPVQHRLLKSEPFFVRPSKKALAKTAGGVVLEAEAQADMAARHCRRYSRSLQRESRTCGVTLSKLRAGLTVCAEGLKASEAALNSAHSVAVQTREQAEAAGRGGPGDDPQRIQLERRAAVALEAWQQLNVRNDEFEAASVRLERDLRTSEALDGPVASTFGPHSSTSVFGGVFSKDRGIEGGATGGRLSPYEGALGRIEETCGAFGLCELSAYLEHTAWAQFGDCLRQQARHENATATLTALTDARETGFSANASAQRLWGSIASQAGGPATPKAETAAAVLMAAVQEARHAVIAGAAPSAQEGTSRRQHFVEKNAGVVHHALHVLAMVAQAQTDTQGVANIVVTQPSLKQDAGPAKSNARQTCVETLGETLLEFGLLASVKPQSLGSASARSPFDGLSDDRLSSILRKELPGGRRGGSTGWDVAAVDDDVLVMALRALAAIFRNLRELQIRRAGPKGGAGASGTAAVSKPVATNLTACLLLLQRTLDRHVVTSLVKAMSKSGGPLLPAVNMDQSSLRECVDEAGNDSAIFLGPAFFDAVGGRGAVESFLELDEAKWRSEVAMQGVDALSKDVVVQIVERNAGPCHTLRRRVCPPEWNPDNFERVRVLLAEMLVSGGDTLASVLASPM